MKKLSLVLFIMVFICGCGTLKSFYSGPEFDDWGGLELPGVQSEDDRAYLGLAAQAKAFELNEVKAEFIIVQIFSFYCPYCQNEASNVNKMYELTQNNKEYSGVKIVGIGTSNTLLEVNEFKKEYNVMFPLFPDKHGDISRKTHYRFTPSFFGVKRNAQGDLEEVLRNPGGIEDVRKFLDELIGKTMKEEVK